MRRPARLVPRLLTTKVLVALGLTLAGATGVSLAVDMRVTANAIARESDVLLRGSLSVAQQALSDERSARQTALRFNAQTLQTAGLTEGTSRVRLQAAAGEVGRNLAVAGVAFATDDGRVLASAGAVPEEVGALDVATAAQPRYLRDPTGGLLEVIGVDVADDLWLVAASAVGDARAFALRRLIGEDVVLLHSGQAVGSTIIEHGAVEEAFRSAPGDRSSIQRDDGPAVVGFAGIGPDAAVAVVAPPLLADLQRDLTSAGAVTFLVLLGAALLLGYVFVSRQTRPLTALAETAEAVGGGRADRRFPTDGDDEIGDLARALERMRTTLQEQVGIITAQSQALQGASTRIATARDLERRRLARDLHDGVQQQLVMLRMRAGMLTGDATADDLAGLARDIDEVIHRLRETSQTIYPSILADRGLTGALYSLAATSVIQMDVALRPDPLPRFAEAVEGGAYFMVAEAITNVVKHAEASIVRVVVDVDDVALTLLVADDGKGFSPSSAPEGAGVQNIRDRAAALGGRAGLRSVPGRGTAVAVVVPRDAASVRAALQVEQDGRDPTVEVVGVPQAELLEDRVGVLLDGAFPDDQGVGDA